MPALNCGRCPKCGRRVSWCGEVVDRPPCPVCKHQVPRADLERGQRQLDADRKLLDELDAIPPLTEKDMPARATSEAEQCEARTGLRRWRCVRERGHDGFHWNGAL